MILILNNLTVKEEAIGKDLVVTITISRERARNAISSDVIKEFNFLIEQFWKNQKLKCLIITGTGTTFCAGADLKEVRTLKGEKKSAYTRSAQKLLMKIQNFPKPVVAVMNGHAFGGGLELALACDVRICVNSAKLGLTELSIGLLPAWGGTQRLPKLIGLSRAKELILLADGISAEDALRLKIIHYCIEKDDINSAVNEIISRILRLSSPYLEKMKELLAY